jgi:hypothetical protein
MSDSTIEIQPSPKNGKPPEPHRLVKLLTTAGHYLKTNVWDPIYLFFTKLWNRCMETEHQKDDKDIELTKPSITIKQSDSDNQLVYRNNSDTEEKMQTIERELSEISVMKISRSTSISSIIREDYVDNNK